MASLAARCSVEKINTMARESFTFVVSGCWLGLTREAKCLMKGSKSASSTNNLWEIRVQDRLQDILVLTRQVRKSKLTQRIGSSCYAEVLTAQVGCCVKANGFHRTGHVRSTPRNAMCSTTHHASKCFLQKVCTGNENVNCRNDTT